MLNYPTHYSNKFNGSPLLGLRSEIDRLFDDLWTSPRMSEQQTQNQEWHPACDVVEADGHYLLTLEMPGIPKDQIKIDLQENKITISGERKQEDKKKSGETWYTERRFGKFTRQFALPAGIDAEKVEAHYQDGVLNVFVPKSSAAKHRQVKVSDGTQAGFFSRMIGDKLAS